MEIGTCLINEAGRQAARKNNKNACFFLVETKFHAHIFKVYINFQRKKLIKLTGTIPLNNVSTHIYIYLHVYHIIIFIYILISSCDHPSVGNLFVYSKLSL